MNAFKIVPKKLNNDELQEIIVHSIANNMNIPDSIIEHFTYVIYGKIKKYLKVPNEDLYSECLLLLLKCYKNYNLNKGARFSTYYVNSLTLFMTRYINKNITYVNKMGNQEMDNFVKLKNKVQKNQATLEEIEAFNIKSQELDDIDRIKSTDEEVKDNCIDNELALKLFLIKIKKILTKREFIIYELKSVYEYNYNEIAYKLNISKQAVRKAHKKIIEKLKTNWGYNEFKF